MTTIQSSHIPPFNPSASRALVPAVPAEAESRAKAPVTPTPSASAINADQQRRLEARVERFSQRAVPDNGTSTRNRQAIQAYQSLTENDERDQVSQLLGVDEYA